MFPVENQVLLLFYILINVSFPGRLFNVIFPKSRSLDYDVQLNKPQIIGFIKLSNNKLKTGCSVKK